MPRRRSMTSRLMVSEESIKLHFVTEENGVRAEETVELSNVYAN